MVNAATERCASGQSWNVDLQSCGADSNQTFRFESTGDDVRIVEVRTGKVLDVEGGSTSNGANIIVYQWHGGSNQRWYVRPVGSRYEIVSVKSGKCITVSRSAGSGSELFQGTCEQLDRQLWQLD